MGVGGDRITDFCITERCISCMFSQEWMPSYLFSSSNRPPVKTAPSSCPLTPSTTGCWRRSGFARRTSSTTRPSRTCSGRTWWQRCSALPCTGSSPLYILYIRWADSGRWNDALIEATDLLNDGYPPPSCSSRMYALPSPSTPRPERSSSVSAASSTRRVVEVEWCKEKGFCTNSKKEGGRLKRYFKRMAKWIRSESYLSVEIWAEGQKQTEITRSNLIPVKDFPSLWPSSTALY